MNLRVEFICPVADAEAHGAASSRCATDHAGLTAISLADMPARLSRPATGICPIQGRCFCYIGEGILARLGGAYVTLRPPQNADRLGGQTQWRAR